MSYSIVGDQVYSKGKVVDTGSGHADAVRAAQDRAKHSPRSSVAVPALPPKSGSAKPDKSKAD